MSEEIKYLTYSFLTILLDNIISIVQIILKNRRHFYLKKKKIRKKEMEKNPAQLLAALLLSMASYGIGHPCGQFGSDVLTVSSPISLCTPFPLVAGQYQKL